MTDSTPEIKESTIELAKSIAALPFVAEFDVENAITTLKPLLRENGSVMADVEPLHKTFIELNVDTEIVPDAPVKNQEDGDQDEDEDEEEKEDQDDADEGKEDEDSDMDDEDKEKPTAPEVPKEYTKKAHDLFKLFTTSENEKVDLAEVLSFVNLVKNGYGEQALKFSVNAYDIHERGCAKEADLWKCLQLCCIQDLTDIQRKHLRRVWRLSDKHGQKSDDEEEMEEADEDEDELPEKPTLIGDEDETKVLIESFFEQLTADEYLSPVLFQEAEIPTKDPDEEGSDEDDEDED